MQSSNARQRWFLSVVAIFFFSAFVLGIPQQEHLPWPEPEHDPHHRHHRPDFSHYRFLRILSEHEFPISDDARRVIVVGDIHGMDKQFDHLLRKLSYNPNSDVLVHVGDTVSRGPLAGSLAVLNYMATHNVTGVRGNHDQMVIEWHAWQDWIAGQKSGLKWLEEKQQSWRVAEGNGVELEDWIEHESRTDKTKWWQKIPTGWKLFSDHYNVADAMSKSEYEYLLSLPLTLYAPAAHTFIVHAGMLSSDPRHKATNPHQPLSHIPDLPDFPDSEPDSEVELSELRRLQDLSILDDIPQNNDPWVLTNIRGIRKDHTITRKNRGKPWAKHWNKDMSHCRGYDLVDDDTQVQHGDYILPCYPSTVLYGHAASRGFDVKRWSIGLDTGCAYGRHLTAVVLSHTKPSLNDAQYTGDPIPYGDHGSAKVVSVRC